MDSSTTLPASSIIPGCILWLTDPDRGRYTGPYSRSDPDSDEEPNTPEPRTMYGHPVMVLHTKGTDDVAICLLTTLDGRDIKVDDHSCDHEFYLAIYPKEPPCVNLYPQLCLERSVQLRKPGYLSIREQHTVHRSKLELYDRTSSADDYKLSPLSYVIVANTFRMNIPIPRELTPLEKYRRMQLPMVGPQPPRTKRAVRLHGETTKALGKTQAPAVQVTQDQKAMDHVSATGETRIEDRRTTEEVHRTQDPSTPAEFERPDGLLIGLLKVPFYMVPSEFVSLLMRVMGYKGASAELKVED